MCININETLFVTDLDGTLLDDTSRVSPRSSQILSALSRKGAMITAATARTPATVQPLLKNVYGTVPAIVMTGAARWDRNAMAYSHICHLTSAAATQVAELCRTHGINPFIYTLGEDSMLHVYHNGRLSKAEEKFIEERRRLALKRFHIDEPRGLEPYIEGTVLMFAIGSRDSIFKVADLIRGKIDCSVSAYIDIFGQDTGILEIFHSGVSKAKAVKQLAADMGAKRIVVFGDNLNDIPMMQIADSSYAVANALDEVKAQATEVIGPNTADSVACTIATLCGENPMIF